jgi:hypothetical protein
MYITHNNQTYANVRVYSTSGSVRFTGDSLSGVTELTGPVTVYADNDFELRVYTPGNFLRQEITDGSWLLTNIPLPEPQPVVVTPAEYGLTVSTANAVRLLMAGKQPTTADEIIMCSALYPEWEAGKHVAGDVFCVGGEPWECFQNYDNAVYPDIVPGGSAWFTFNRPYHGTSRETARNFVHPTGAHDMYKAGEWAVQDGKFTKANQDTAYSLAEYPQAWDVEE